MILRIRYIILFAVALCYELSYSQYTPFFQNYTLTEFGAGNKNWGMSMAKTGELYVANDKGLIEFDGVKWDFYQLPNKTIIRSVLAHNGVVFTGSYEEFGYWKRNSNGRLSYTSLSDFKELKTSSAEEFWQIFHYQDTILFRSFSGIYIYKNDKIQRITPESTILSCSIVDNKVYVATVKGGIFVLQDDELQQIISHPQLTDTKVVTIANYHNKLFISTALKGCFLYNKADGTLSIWTSEINETIKAQQLNSLKMLKNGNMVFGTIKNGVYITDNTGSIKYHINKENGLLNNTVLSHALDVYNNLWLGLDNGLSRIDLNFNHILYNDNSGKLGAVYDVINHNETLYLGSNTGLFYLNKDNGILEFVEGSQGQVWELKEINNQLLCGHNNGTYLVENNTIKKISEYTGGWMLKKFPDLENTFVQGTYGGLVRFEIVNGEWIAQHLGGEIIPIKFLEFEDAKTAWVAHAYKGLFRVKFNENKDSILSFKNYKDKGLWSGFNVKVDKIKNTICFKTNEGWQKYEALLDTIVPYNVLNMALGKSTNILSKADGDELITQNSKGIISFMSLSKKKNTKTLSSRLMQKRLVVNAESVSKLNDSAYTFNLYDGFLLINKSVEETKHVLRKPKIKQIEVDHALIDIKGKNTYEFPFNKNIAISLTAPLSTNHFFEYTMTSTKDYSWVKMDKEKLELSGLSNGDYKVYFRTSNVSGEVSAQNVLNITILPPWYKNKWFYLLLISLGSILFYGLHKQKINKEQKRLHDKLVKEQEVLLKEKTIENDKKIIQLKNQSLKNEIKLKSKQLANTAMALVKKNESMLEIKEELEKSKSNFSNALAFKRLLRKIDNSIGHEDEWELFEYNFNQVHEEFFNQLKAKHPKLTHRDLKICAYIKMNLLTKEIAPLMNVSIRGLETHRYRLKRKLNLENDKSLADYLRNLQ